MPSAKFNPAKLGINLSSVKGSGYKGLIKKEDIILP